MHWSKRNLFFFFLLVENLGICAATGCPLWKRLETKGTAGWLFECGSIKIKAWVSHPVLSRALLISMHPQADVCGALIGSFPAFFLTNPVNSNSL